MQNHGCLVTSGSCERSVFSWERQLLCHEVFFRMYKPLAKEITRRVFMDCLGFMAVNGIKKHPKIAIKKCLTKSDS